MAYQSSEIAQLLARQEALNEQLAQARDRESRLALLEIVQKMREYGISLNELMGRKAGVQHAQQASDESSVKYRDPVSGSTWSGRGRAPHWIAGKDRNAFLVDARDAVRVMVQTALFPDQH
jgi:DNA-binding protein H-NS